MSYANNVHRNANVGAVVAIEVETGDVLAEKCVVADGEELDAFVIETPSVGKEYTIVLSKENDIGSGLSRMSYRMYNPFDKVDGLRHIESIGHLVFNTKT